MFWEADLENFEFTYVSQEAVKLVGYETDQWYEPDFFASHLHPDDLERVLAVRWKHEPGRVDLEFRMLAQGQNIVWIRTLAEIVEEDDAHCLMRGFMIDITDRKQIEETLCELGGRLISAQEEERSRVARELHDDVNQRMAVLSIQLDQLQQDLHMSLDLSLRYKDLKAQVQEISNDIHRLSYRLHPAKLDHLGLGAAVESLCAELSESGQLQIKFYKSRVPANLPPDITLCIFRIAQEALHNCLKHSGARAVEVRLERSKSDIHLSVSDDGCGFDQESALIRKGLGFISMQERLRLVDGCVQIHSKPLRGTRIEVLVPLTRKTKRSDLEEPLARTEGRDSETKPLLIAVSVITRRRPL
jgi:PAS domain S-box-containing protein